jgi:uncharacterized phage protein (TIGR01671 family)
MWDKTNSMWVGSVLDSTTTHVNEWFIDDNLIFQQYAGLKDKDEVEIYEGDIVEVGFGEHKGSLGQIIFEYGSFMLQGKYGGIFMDTYKSCLYGRVIGNIIETPF